MPLAKSTAVSDSLPAAAGASRSNTTVGHLLGAEQRQHAFKDAQNGVMDELPPIAESKVQQCAENANSNALATNSFAEWAQPVQRGSSPDPPPLGGFAVPAVKKSSVCKGRTFTRTSTASTAARSVKTQGLSWDMKDTRAQTFSIDDVLDSDHRDKSELDPFELLELAHSCRWHLIGPQVPMSSMEYPQGTKAIIIALHLQDVEPARQMVSQLTSAQSDLPPVLGLLLDVKDCEDVAQVSVAQSELLAMGMDDVICNAMTRQQVKLSIVMGLTRARDKARVLSGMEDELRGIYEERLRSKVQAWEAKRSEPKTGFFWQAIHRTFEDFPHLDRRLVVDPTPGAKVGPCEVESSLGRGMFGIVYATRNADTGEREALKVVDKESLVELEAVVSLWREMHYLGKLRHENVVGILGAMHGPRHICIRMELAGRVSLFRAMKAAGGRFELDVVKGYFAQISAAVAHCHSQGVAHRDLKPENIALAENMLQIKVVDFGTAASCRKPRTDLVGTMPFVAPEVLSVVPQVPYWPAGVDIWSCGVVLLEMVCGIDRMNSLVGWDRSSVPCRERSLELQALFVRSPQAIRESVRRQLVDDDVFDLQELLQGMLKFEPGDRMSAFQVNSSPWLLANRRRSDRAIAQDQDIRFYSEGHIAR